MLPGLMSSLPPTLHPDFATLWPRVAQPSPDAIHLDDRALPFNPHDLVRSLEDVAWELYLRWYNRTDDLDDFSCSQAEYDTALRLLGSGRDRWDRDWVVKLVLEDGAVLVEKHARRQWVQPGGYVLRNPHARAHVGTRVDLFVPGVSDSLQQSFVYFFGRALPENDPSLDHLRIYLSFTPERLLDILRALVPALDGHYVPYRLKVLREVADFRRADSAVLYIEDRYVPLVLRLLSGATGGEGRPGPRLVAVLWPGVGMAEDPAGGASFGLVRCHSIAYGLSHLLGRNAAPGEIPAAVAAALQSGGVDLARPWYRPDSHRSAAYRTHLGFPA